MTGEAFGRAIAFLRAHQNPDGGWGYQPGQRSIVEPTGLCLFAMSEERDGAAAAAAGMNFLRACRQESGAVGVDPSDTEGSWMAYAALLAFGAFGSAEETRRLVDWSLAMEDASGRFSPEEVSSIALTYRYDASIRGWPWTPGTTAWVEPTALFMIALTRAGVSREHERLRSGVRLLVDRQVSSGGWNFGNPYGQVRELEASPLSTAIALAGLGAAGYPRDRRAVQRGLRYLAGALDGDVSTVALAWALLALRGYALEIPAANDPWARLRRLQAEDGSFRENCFETALAAIVLSDLALIFPMASEVG